MRQWLVDHPGDAAMIGALDRTAETLGDTPTGPIDVEAALDRVKARFNDPVVGSLAGRSGVAGTDRMRRQYADRNIRTENRYGWRIAAGLLVAALGAWTWHFARTRTETGNAELAASSYDSGVGKPDTVHLADGSSVVLAPGSHLSVSARYGAGERQVDLRGEAYFDVVHDDTRPFVVHAGGAVIRDVGTTFAVRAREDAVVRVAVTSGAILLGSTTGAADSGVVLHQGDAGTVGARGVVHATRGGATDDDVAWKEGRLVFRNASLSEVAAEVKRWYGIELRFDDAALAQGHLTHTAMAGEPVENLLNIIAQTRGARWEKRGDTVDMHPGR